MLKGAIQWPELYSGELIKRYKRFIADVRLQDGRVVFAHCPNSGSMKGCSEPGRPVYLSYHDNPKRKLKYTWQLIKMPSSLVGVNTLIPNQLVHQSIFQGMIPELDDYTSIQREVRIGAHTRLDLVLEAENKPKCFVEVKNCTMVENSTALFPDAVTSRGLKHLTTLMDLKKEGYRCVMFYVIQRMDALTFSPAKSIDPDYAKGLHDALKAGIEVLAYDVHIDTTQIYLRNPLSLAL